MTGDLASSRRLETRHRFIPPARDGMTPQDRLERVAGASVHHLLAPVTTDDDQVEAVLLHVLADCFGGIICEHDVDGRVSDARMVVAIASEAGGHVLAFRRRASILLLEGLGIRGSARRGARALPRADRPPATRRRPTLAVPHWRRRNRPWFDDPRACLHMGHLPRCRRSTTRGVDLDRSSRAQDVTEDVTQRVGEPECGVARGAGDARRGRVPGRDSAHPQVPAARQHRARRRT